VRVCVNCSLGSLLLLLFDSSLERADMTQVAQDGTVTLASYVIFTEGQSIQGNKLLA